ncbi:hypothetical protein [Burkholderia multivorans]|uniref:hypothetical protein n=1 Tax=Burkholderia multivorans TaxID=87883 RepID=UPI0021BED7FE|nr:hypothetical protein [Burkholderia multivorans]
MPLDAAAGAAAAFAIVSTAPNAANVACHTEAPPQLVNRPLAAHAWRLPFVRMSSLLLPCAEIKTA